MPPKKSNGVTRKDGLSKYNIDASRFPRGRGPQGDVSRINNFVRCVRGGAAKARATGPKVEMKPATRRGPFDGQADSFN